LAVILFPVFAQAREKARAISCLSNMKQLGLGMRMYSQDYDERAGAVSTWFCPNQAPEVPPQQGEGSWQALSLYYPYIKNIAKSTAVRTSQVIPIMANWSGIQQTAVFITISAPTGE